MVGYPFLKRRAPTFASPEINNVYVELKIVMGQRRKAACHVYHMLPVLRIRIRDPVLFLTPEYGTEKNSEP